MLTVNVGGESIAWSPPASNGMALPAGLTYTPTVVSPATLAPRVHSIAVVVASVMTHGVSPTRTSLSESVSENEVPVMVMVLPATPSDGLTPK